MSNSTASAGSQADLATFFSGLEARLSRQLTQDRDSIIGAIAGSPRSTSGPPIVLLPDEPLETACTICGRGNSGSGVLVLVTSRPHFVGMSSGPNTQPQGWRFQGRAVAFAPQMQEKARQMMQILALISIGVSNGGTCVRQAERGRVCRAIERK